MDINIIAPDSQTVNFEDLKPGDIFKCKDGWVFMKLHPDYVDEQTEQSCICLSSLPGNTEPGKLFKPGTNLFSCVRGPYLLAIQVNISF